MGTWAANGQWLCDHPGASAPPSPIATLVVSFFFHYTLQALHRAETQAISNNIYVNISFPLFVYLSHFHSHHYFSSRQDWITCHYPLEMAIGSTNQFALLDDEATSPESKVKGNGKAAISPAAKAKATGAAVRGKKLFKALVITAQSAAPAARGRLRNRPHANNGHMPVTPNPTDGAGKSLPHHENWCGVCRLLFSTKLSLQSHVKQSPGHDFYCKDVFERSRISTA